MVSKLIIGRAQTAVASAHSAPRTGGRERKFDSNRLAGAHRAAQSTRRCPQPHGNHIPRPAGELARGRGSALSTVVSLAEPLRHNPQNALKRRPARRTKGAATSYVSTMTVGVAARTRELLVSASGPRSLTSRPAYMYTVLWSVPQCPSMYSITSHSHTGVGGQSCSCIKPFRSVQPLQERDDLALLISFARSREWWGLVGSRLRRLLKVAECDLQQHGCL